MNGSNLDSLPLSLVLDIAHDLDTMDLLNLSWTSKKLRDVLTGPDSNGVWAYRLLKKMSIRPTTPTSPHITAHQMVVDHARLHYCSMCHCIDGGARFSKIHNKKLCVTCLRKIRKGKENYPIA
jgi:hypothetical protein